MSSEDIRTYIRSDKFKEDAARSRSFGSEPSAADLEEVPELTEEELARAFRPAKQFIGIRLDQDILEWLKTKDGPYQTRINAMLRAIMIRDKAAVPGARKRVNSVVRTGLQALKKGKERKA